PMNYDFWYQPRKNTLVSSEFGVPTAYEPGFDLADVEAGRYGQRLHFSNLERRELEHDRPGFERARPARNPLETRPRRRRRLRRRRAVVHDLALPPRKRLPPRPGGDEPRPPP